MLKEVDVTEQKYLSNILIVLCFIIIIIIIFFFFFCGILTVPIL